MVTPLYTKYWYTLRVSSPFFSIIIPVYNSRESIRTLVTSIVAQNFEDFELILVDDGSTDGSLNTLRGLQKGDSRIIVRAQKNGGPSSARNTGLEKARGKYILFFDADDDISSSALETIADALRDDSADVLVFGWTIDLHLRGRLITNHKHISPPDMQLSGDSLKKYVIRSIGDSGQLYNLWNKVFRGDTIRQHHLRFREDIRFGEDLIFFFHYLRHATHIKLIPNTLYRYRSGDSGLFSTSSLIPEYRKVNYEELATYIGKNPNEELTDLYHWVRWRWLLSYWLQVSAADVTHKEKVVLLESLSVKNDFSLAHSPRHIGIKKWLLEHIAAFLARTPGLALIVVGIAEKFRK